MIGTNENFLNQRISVLKISGGNNNPSMQNCYLHCTVCCLVHSKLHSNESRHLELGDGIGKQDDLFRCFKHFLRFGKIFGIIPLDGVFGDKLSDLRFRWKSPGSIYSIIVVGLLLINLVIGLMGLLRFGGRNATEWAWNAESFVFYLMGVFTHIYFMMRGKNLIQVFRKWREVDLKFTEIDKYLFRDVNLIAGIIYSSAILENALLQIIFLYFTIDPTIAAEPPMHRYYIKAQTHWASFIPYHETFAILVFWSNKFALYSWNFVDILSIMMSRAIYYKFKALNQTVIQRMDSKQLWQDPEMWIKIVQDHDTLCHLLKIFERFLSPLLFASYAINCFYICLQLHLGLSKGEASSTPHKIYMIWSFCHLLVRVFMVSLSAAKINDYAHKILEIFYLCPHSCEGIEVKRARFRISSTKIGLSGLGSFIITRKFMLKLISICFTFEIVLLQQPHPLCCNSTSTC